VVGLPVVGVTLGFPDVTVGRALEGLLVVGEAVVGLLVLGLDIVGELVVGVPVFGEALGFPGVTVGGEVVGLPVVGESVVGLLVVGKAVLGIPVVGVFGASVAGNTVVDLPLDGVALGFPGVIVGLVVMRGRVGFGDGL
jgi:hypothetical protein